MILVIVIKFELIDSFNEIFNMFFPLRCENWYHSE